MDTVDSKLDNNLSSLCVFSQDTGLNPKIQTVKVNDTHSTNTGLGSCVSSRSSPSTSLGESTEPGAAVCQERIRNKSTFFLCLSTESITGRRLAFILPGLASTLRCCCSLQSWERFVSSMGSSPTTTTSGGQLHKFKDF